MPAIFWIIFVFLLVAAVVPDARSRELARLIESVHGAADRERNELLEYVKAHREEIKDQLRSQGFADIPYGEGKVRITLDEPAVTEAK